MENLFKVIAETFNVKEASLNDGTKIEDIASWDSLTHMELIANLEGEYKVEFTADEIMEMVSVGKIRQIVERKIDGNQG